MIKSASIQSGLMLTVLSLICLLLGWILIPNLTNPFPLSRFNITLLFFYLVNLFVLLQFPRGKKQQDKKKAVVLTFFAIALKFFLYLIFLISYYLITKKLTTEFIFSFFILYLTFTFFSTWRLLNNLNIKE